MQYARRKCSHLYYYFKDRDLGLIHVMVQTWFPMRMQVFVNGHNWLANKLEDNGIGFKRDNSAQTNRGRTIRQGVATAC